jgi:uncharacterized membrane protein (UPF0182 family)
MKINKNIIIIIAALLLAFYLLTLFLNYYSNWLWFNNMQYGSVFNTMLSARVSSFIVFFVTFAVFFSLNIRRAFQNGNVSRNSQFLREDDPRKLILNFYHGKAVFWLWGVTTLFFSTLVGTSAVSHWSDFLQFIHASSFGIKDPVFGKDASFYVFKLPVYRYIVSLYLMIVVITVVGVLVSYFLDSAIGLLTGNKLKVSARAKNHLIRLTGFFMLGISASFFLKLYDNLYSSQGPAYGPSYVTVHAQIPADWAIFAMSVVLTILLFLMPLIKKYKLLLYSAGLWLAILVGFVWIYPGIVEQYEVKPTELSKETPYILNNIKFTREAYGLSKVRVKPFPVDQSLTYQDIKENRSTIENIRLWDRRPLIQTYKQLQEIRLYYDFKSVQIDRYHFDKYTEVALAARELPVSQIPARAQTWVNEHLIYTHGYGVVMNPVNKVMPDGMPDLIMKDIPPTTTTPLSLKQMAIYYGEETDQYVLVNTNVKEFDFPRGDKNVYTEYMGDGGVRISNLFRRILYAWKFSDVKILLTGYLTPKSRIMFYRNIVKRDQTIAPFLTYDTQPYLVVGKDGQLYWIHDAYTTSNMFPYSEPVSQSQIGNSFNYINNSVKVVINAYSGDVSYYVINPNDPIVVTLQKIYPRLFKPFSAMPDFLKAHIRYPTDLFNIQTQIYNVYHMTDPKVFYNQEDYWEVPDASGDNGARTKMFPYYVIMRLPGTTNEESILMLPLTPSKKDNMIAWMCARCDVPNYGELIVYTLPKDKLVYGPIQIEGRINQKPDISAELTLWGQHGSLVFKGNQLVIPINNSFIYVEPMYLQSQEGQIPELKRVIVIYKDQIEMRETLDEALEAIFNSNGQPDSTRVQPEMIMGGGAKSALSDKAKEALAHYNKAVEYLKKDNWEGYGKELQQMKAILSEMSEDSSTSPETKQ